MADEHEREVQHDPQVLEGKAFVAMRWAWLVLIVVIAVVLWALVR
jgi:hypothetical protein